MCRQKKEPLFTPNPTFQRAAEILSRDGNEFLMDQNTTPKTRQYYEATFLRKALQRVLGTHLHLSDYSETDESRKIESDLLS